MSFWFTSVVLLLLWLKDGVALALAWVDLGGERLEIINDGMHGDRPSRHSNRRRDPRRP